MNNRGFQKVSFEQWDKDNELIPESQKAWDEIILPRRGTAMSAGYDIFSTVDFILEPGEEIKFPLGIKVYMQPNEYFEIVPRSGLGFKYYVRLANTVGIIDADYYNNPKNEGHCFMKIRNEGQSKLSVKTGDGIAQGIFKEYLLADGDSFDGKERNGGFGSTSK